MNHKLDQEEKEILQSYEAGEWVSVSTPSSIAEHKAAAKRTLENNKDYFRQKHAQKGTDYL